RRDVDVVRLELAAELALAAVVATAGRRVVGALLGLEMARQDTVHGPGEGHPLGLAGHVVAYPGGELAEVHVIVEGAHVAGHQRLALGLITPPALVAAVGISVALASRLVVAEGDIEEGAGRARGQRSE